MENIDDQIIIPELESFHTSNPALKARRTVDGFEIRNLWGLPELYLSFSDLDSLLSEALNHVRFDERFDAIIHEDKGEIEFVFAFLNPHEDDAKDYLNRSFDLSFMNRQYSCRFAAPTDRLFNIAKVFRRVPSENSQQRVPQLNAFRDWHRLAEMPERVQKFFEGKEPRSFFISNLDATTNIPQLCRHVNRLCHYYDRHSPQIIIRESASELEETKVRPCRYLPNGFPSKLAVRPVDDVILTLLEVGASSSPRNAYLYYYQVLEYAGYFYTDEKIKGRLRHILRDPAIVCCDDDTIAELFDALLDHHHNDDIKIQRVIEENVNMRTVWIDVWNDHEFFATKTEFDGGFVADALLSKDTTEDAWATLAIPKLFKVLTQIRNVIVHAREKRENKVILPTDANAKRLRRFVPVMRRIAEEVAFRY